MKKLFKILANNLAYTIIGIILAMSAGIVLAANVTVPPAQQKGSLPVGINNKGNYQVLNPGSDGLFLRASSTTISGFDFATASTSGGTGLANLNGLVAATQTFATSVTGTLFNVTSSGTVHTFTFPASPTFTNLTLTNPLPIASGGTGTTSLSSFTLASLTLGGSNLSFTSGDGIQVLVGTTTTISLSNSPSFSGTLTVVGTSTLATTTVTSFTATGLPTLSGVANCNSTQFLQITSGLFGCGTPAGGGGGSGGGFSTSSPNIIYSNYPTATTAFVGINSSTPTANLTVQGISGSTTPIFIVSSSSNTSIFSVAPSLIPQFQLGTTTATALANFYIQGTTASSTIPLFTLASSSGVSALTVAANGSTTINSLATANCDVLATVTGSLYCGTNGAGGSGNSAFTFGSGLIYNATSTDLVGIGTITPTTTLFVQGKGGTNPFAVASSTGSQLLTLTQAGSLGIGTTSPIEKLTVQGGSILVDNSQSYITKQTNGTETILAYMDSSNVVRFNSSNLYTVLSVGGKVGINTSTGGSTLTVSAAATVNPFTVASSSGAVFLQVNSNGNIGIGTTTPIANLSIQGSSGQTAALFDIASSSGASILQVSANTIPQFQIGTTTTASLANLYVQGGSASSTIPLLIVASSTATTILFQIDPTGSIGSSSSPPTLSSCGTTPSVTSGSDKFGGEITVGSVSASGCTITFPTPFVKKPACILENENLGIVNAFTYTVSTSSIVASQTGLTGSLLTYICKGMPN